MLNKLEKYFDTDDLYKILNLKSTANLKQIKTSYYKLSLKYHPDKCKETNRKEVNEKFSLINMIYSVLSDEESRNYYDSTGSILQGNLILTKKNMNWKEYWRMMFPAISTTDIKNYLENYQNSEIEKIDIKKCYIDAKGDLDKIYQSLIGYDMKNENRIKNVIMDLIDQDEVEKYEIFINEPEIKKKKRHKKMKLQAKEAEKCKDGEDEKDLIALIRNKNKKKDCEDFLDGLAEKYNDTSKKKKKKCNK
ncbi:DnaJ subfamily C member 9 [Intoshia linei]|uniref:DnaJ subfamily C member 9 n=1 Tax=Intoshia linei TaxID=1819745 RepID=A0A177AY00_9BILA|nr:DnaJ subfamily C member 9 [Intoshia linei]